MNLFPEYSLAALDGSGPLLGATRGKVVLLVNVASECGYTPQYEELQSLHDELRSMNFTVLAVPCNQFGAQEPGTPEQIQVFCSTRFGVTFPLSVKIEVKGPGKHPLYAWLCAEEQGFPGDIDWNFEKFLIGRDGKIRGKYPAGTTPRDAGLLADIADALGETAAGVPT